MYGRVVPTVGNERGGYLSWHKGTFGSSLGVFFRSLLNRSCCPDHPQPDDEDLPSYRNVKVFVYVWDVPLSGGETAVVPGTHRVAGSPGETLSPGKFASAANGDAAAQSTMPNLVRAAVGAGCALLFDSSIWHTSMPNTSGRDRCSCQFSYRSSECSGAESREPSWGPRAGLSERALRRLAAEGRLGVARRRILGLPDAGEGGRL